jgi:hypothetical protein
MDARDQEIMALFADGKAHSVGPSHYAVLAPLGRKGWLTWEARYEEGDLLVQITDTGRQAIAREGE